MNRTLVVSLFLLCCVFLAACGSNEAATAAPVSNDAPAVIEDISTVEAVQPQEQESPIENDIEPIAANDPMSPIAVVNLMGSLYTPIYGNTPAFYFDGNSGYKLIGGGNSWYVNANWENGEVILAENDIVYENKAFMPFPYGVEKSSETVRVVTSLGLQIYIRQGVLTVDDSMNSVQDPIRSVSFYGPKLHYRLSYYTEDGVDQAAYVLENKNLFYRTLDQEGNFVEITIPAHWDDSQQTFVWDQP